MDYRIYRNKTGQDSSSYIEIGPGKYSGNHWQDGFLFINEDDFNMAEGILAKHLPGYDHYDMNDIPKDVGQKVTAEWRDVAGRLSSMNAEQALTALNRSAPNRASLGARVIQHRVEIASMLSELADACDKFYKTDDWVCVLGM